jgi:hypothetical protein
LKKKSKSSSKPIKIFQKTISLIFIFFLCRGKTQFVISFSTIEPFEFINTSYSIDIYKEAVIASGDLSNLSPTNRGIRTMSKRYAEENGFEDVLLLNEKKKHCRKSSRYFIFTPRKSNFNSWLGIWMSRFYLS